MRLACVALVALGCTAPASDTDAPDAPTPTTVRVVSWNIQGLGRPGSDEALAEAAVLRRLGADVVGLNEVDGDDLDDLAALAEAAGYTTFFLPADNPFGDLRNAVLARREVAITPVPASGLSGDRLANDVTRLPLRVEVEVPEADARLTVVVNHYKSGFDEADRFRRTLDGLRTAQAADVDGPVVLLGDLNADRADMPESPAVWTRPASGLPRTLVLGQDLADRLASDGLPNDAFAPALDLGLQPVDARQLDGRAATRPASGRRIDWILVSEDLADGLASEVYDSLDEGREGLPKHDAAPDRYASEAASDHLPVVADLVVGG